MQLDAAKREACLLIREYTALMVPLSDIAADDIANITSRFSLDVCHTGGDPRV
jgi:hypothetical protein